MSFDASFFVAFSFALVILGFLKLGLPGRVASMLDARADKIREELEQAQSLRDEAQALLKSYRQRAKKAEEESRAMIEQAKVDSEKMAEDAKTALQVRLERKTRQAEDKIGQAEVQLSQEIRAVAAELAISAAGKLISEILTTETADKILDSSIKNVSSHLN